MHVRETSLPVPPTLSKFWHIRGSDVSFLLQTLEPSLPKTIHCFSTGDRVGRKSMAKAEELRVITSTEEAQVQA